MVKTAKILGQSQPSASRQIEQFQKFFKKKLFVQRGKNKQLTAYGEEVRNYYKDGVSNLRLLRENFYDHIIFDQKEKLVLAARSEILQRYVAPLKFNSLIELCALSGDEIRDKMSARAIDVAVLQENFDTYDYFRKKLFISNWVIAAPKSWQAKSLTELQHLPFAAYEQNLKYLPRGKFQGLDIKFIANDWRLLSDKVARQEYWSIMPLAFCESAKISIIPMDLIMKETPFYLYFRKDLSKNRDVQYMVDQLS